MDEWYSRDSLVEERGEGGLERDEAQDLLPTRGMDRYVIPEDFFWDLGIAMQSAGGPV